MKTSISTIFSLVFGAMVSGSAWGQIDSIVQNCNGCHGDDGVSQWSDVPTIGGMPEFTHADALYFYREGERPCAESEYRQGDTSRPAASMCEVTADLSDDQIDEIAAYYAGKPFVPAEQEFDAALAAAGNTIHDEHCEMCHTDGGSNPDDEAGILAGQQMGYLKMTFDQYNSGEREQDATMQSAMDKLSDDDVQALLNYYVSQQ